MTDREAGNVGDLGHRDIVVNGKQVTTLETPLPASETGANHASHGFEYTYAPHGGSAWRLHSEAV